MHLPSLAEDLGGPSAAARQAALLAEAAGDEPPPRLIAWDLARRCRRADCVPCLLQSGGGAPVGELSTIESLHVAGQLVAQRPGMLLLSGGDPLAREDLETIASAAVRRGASAAVATPGDRLTEKRLDALVAAGVTGVVVALAWPRTPGPGRSEGHGGGSAADAMAAPSRARLRGLRVVVHALLHEPSRDAAAALARWSSEQGANALHVELPAGIAGDAGDLRATLQAERELAVQERRLRKRMAVRVARRGEATGCACDPLACRITADGKLTACACAPGMLADLRREPFAAAWASAPVLAARRRLALEPAADPPAPAEDSQLSLQLGPLSGPAR